MKEIEVQIENKDKEIIKSSVIKIDENSDKIKVVVSVGECNGRQVDFETVGKIHQVIVKAIEDGSKVITMPSFVKINTIKI